MNAPGEPLLDVENVTLDLSGRRILQDISLKVGTGEFLGLIGPNGGGKTTLLRVLLGLVAPSHGTVYWSSRSGHSARIGYVPQRGGLDRNFPLSSREVVELGAPGKLPLFGEARRVVEREARELIDRVGLRSQSETPFVYLSGGQQRRLLLARALMAEPDVLLLDEPTAGVDLQGQEQLCVLLSELAREGISVILVSHDIPLITSHADRIACLNGLLHWHGDANHLDQDAINATYACELDRYKVAAKAVADGGPQPLHFHPHPHPIHPPGKSSSPTGHGPGHSA